MVKKILLTILLCGIPAWAQDALPSKPEPTVRVQLTDGQRKWYEQLPVKHKTVDHAWWEWAIVSGGMTILDAENSLYALHKPGTSEANGIFGSHPSRAKYYGIMLPVAGLGDILSYKYKREDDALKSAGMQGHKYSKWWIIQAMNTGAHVVGVAITLGSTGR